MNEQQYIELTNQLKVKFNDNEIIRKKSIRKFNELYKTLTICYGLVRCYVDNNHYHCEHDILIGELRSLIK